MSEDDFCTPLRLEYIDGRNWKVIDPFEYRSITGMIVVPINFVTDFASVPRFFWRVLPPTGRYGKAAVVHDYLYRTRRAPKAVADLVFLEAMEDLGVPGWKRKTMYWAVRLCGGFAYGKQSRVTR